MNTCKSCGAGIQWAFTAVEGNRIPINAEPDADGNIELSPGTGRLIARVLTKAQLERRRGDALPGMTPRLYKTHFATCPAGPRWRKKKS